MECCRILSYLLYGSVAPLPSPSSNIEAWPYGGERKWVERNGSNRPPVPWLESSPFRNWVEWTWVDLEKWRQLLISTQVHSSQFDLSQFDLSYSIKRVDLILFDLFHSTHFMQSPYDTSLRFASLLHSGH